MSLISSIQLANNTLRAQQVGIQVVGQNIANTNTPGYIREEVVLSPAPTQKIGSLLLGLGVEVTAVIQKIDKFLEERLRGAQSDTADSEVRQETYLQLESVIGELSDTDLSTSLNDFFSSINEVLNQPESVPVRNLAVLQGKTLASEINLLSNRVLEMRSDIDDQIVETASEINRLVENVALLNKRISATEGGGTSASDAVGLRDQRGLALSDLAKLIDIKTTEQADGTVNVYIGGDFLVLQGEFRNVSASQESTSGRVTTTVKLTTTKADLQLSSGKLAGLVAGRDDILGDFLTRLDSFASTMMFEFNKVFSSGQGLTGHNELTSEFAITDSTVALDAAGLRFTPVNGSFQVLVRNKEENTTVTTDIHIDLNGLGNDDTTYADFVAQLNNIDGLTAVIEPTGKLNITTDSSDSEFSFAGDTSGLLAALGLNTFFTGTGASSIGVSQFLQDDPTKFAASTNGIGEDTKNAEKLAAFLDKKLDTVGGTTLSILYNRLTGETTQASAVAQSVAEGFKVFEDTLSAQQLGVSGVSLDEEAVKLITFQRAYQATARYIATVSELLEVLVNL